MRIFRRSTIVRQSRWIFDDAPVDAICGVIRAGSEQIGQLIGANDLLIAARALALDPTVVTDNEREFLRMMTFGSKTGYGKVDLILQPSHL